MDSLLSLLSIRGIGSIRARHLIEAFGSAQAVLEAPKDQLLQLGNIGQMIIDGKSDSMSSKHIEEELTFIEKNHIRPLIYGEEGYPKRLLECEDAPAILFQLGDTPLDETRIVSIVGTRNCTQYGRELVHRFVSELHEAFPNVIIVSGLALGIDVESHKAALNCEARTVGVVAHGLDRIYPSQHRSVAKEMLLNHGSIITEYMTGTEPERGNFLSRNRIIAGLSDAIIVAESKDKGGSLVTASIALDYNRDVFAFPGRVGDTRSEGCNRLIRLNRAGLITCAQDFIEAMNWETSHCQKKSIQHSIPFEEENLTPNARLILDALRDRGDLLLSQLSDATGLDHSTLYEELLDLEMDSKIRSTPGGLYQLR